MTTFYMVEMSFPFPEERADFDRFYDRHIGMLLSIPGFRSAQRFEATHEARAPLMAVYELDGPQVLSSEAYTSRAGPRSVSETYRPKMQSWDRNVLTGPSLRLDVPAAGWLRIVDRLEARSPPLPPGFAVFTPAGLDRTVLERGLRAGADAGAMPPAPGEHSGWTVRTFRPLGVRRTPEG